MKAGFPWLTLVAFVPLAGAVVMTVLPSRATTLLRLWALAVTLVAFGLSLGMLGAYAGGHAGFQLVERHTWVRSLNFRYIVGIDGISLFMVLLTTFLMPVAVLVSWNIEKQVKYYMVAFLVLETAMIGCFVALDLLLFFLFFEALLFPMYLIIGGWGSERRVYAAVKFFLFTMAGSAFLFVAVLFLYFRAGSALGQPTFDLTVLQGLSLPTVTARWLFLAFFVAFAVKVPLFPLHTWLPDAHTEAPTAGSVVLAAVLLKVGAYGLIRFNLSLFPEASMYFKEFVSILALIGIVYGAIVALIQVDLKRLVAYSSVSHLGFVVLGIFAFTQQGMSGSVLQMVNHGLSTGALFLLVGMLYDRIHTRDLTKMGGLSSRVPIYSGVLLFVALSSVGLPGLNGFVGEFLILLGTFISNKVFAAVAVSGLVLAAIYLLWAYQRAMHGPPTEEHGGILDLSLREKALLVPLLLAILFIGLYPKPLLDRIEPASNRTVRCVQLKTSSTTYADLSQAQDCGLALGQPAGLDAAGSP